ncbi:HK97 family phage prohead protease [Pseudomonas arsenicoxydans]|uniref:HK97 family phage prohead protease n=1 Tax=Pseudomonas arsenicoxydans TaxID=702115 RepID=A0A502HNT8_9PSED|nr:HK97 family phage prohead protease [Pseudomonas arsenicoxydans]TPG76321.1 HK97 family phage prohead protease [Pseudomonas arsenicoxydans]
MANEVKAFIRLERKAFSEDDDFFEVSGYLAVFGNVDYWDDVVEPGAFTKSLMAWESSGYKLPTLFSHDHTEPVGVFTEMREDSYGLFVKAKLPKADRFVTERMVPQIKCGSISGMSIGYYADEVAYREHIRLIKSCTLFEGSLCVMPANSQSRITGVKSAAIQEFPTAARDTRWDSKAAELRLREWSGASDAPNKKYKTCFLWSDESASDFKGCKLPFVDIVDGEPKVVPKAVFAAAATIAGAYGGVDVPEDEQKSVVESINAYYKRMDLEPPLAGKSFRIDDLELFSERDLERQFCEGVSFSRKTAKLLVAKIKVKENNGQAELAAGLKSVVGSLKNIVDRT